MYINNPGYARKMAVLSIYGTKPSKIFYSKTGKLTSTKLDMKHVILTCYIVTYLNHYNMCIYYVVMKFLINK